MSFSENLINIFNEVSKQFGIVIDWSNKNVLPYIKDLSGRIVRYEQYTSIGWILLALIVMIIGIILVIKGISKYKDENRPSYNDSYMGFLVAGIIFIFCSSTVTIKETGDVITTITLPEKTLIEFVKDFKQ